MQRKHLNALIEFSYIKGGVIINFDNISNDGMNEMESEIMYDKLIEIFDYNGMDKELEKLVAFGANLVNVASSYKKDKSANDFKKLVYFLGLTHTVIEEIMISNADVYEKIDSIRDAYVEREFKRLGLDMPLFSSAIMKNFSNYNEDSQVNTLDDLPIYDRNKLSDL